jgi:hypothetical protein
LAAQLPRRFIIVKNGKVLLAGLFLLVALGLSAQNEPRGGDIGIVASVANNLSTIGANINLTKAIVLRPTVGYTYDYFSYLTGETETDNSATNTINARLLGLYGFNVAPNVVLGLGPFFGVSFQNSSSEINSSLYRYLDWSVGLDIEAQYYLSQNIAVFIAYNATYRKHTGSYTNASSTTVDLDASDSFSTSGASLGVIVMLR